jgi:hypothetical protein
MNLKFTNMEREVVIYHATSRDTNESVQRASLGEITGANREAPDRSGWLRWGKDGVLVLQGSVSCAKAGEVKVCCWLVVYSFTDGGGQLESVTFHIREGDWRIELPFDLQAKLTEGVVQSLLWYSGKRFVPLRGSGSAAVRYAGQRLAVRIH